MSVLFTKRKIKLSTGPDGQLVISITSSKKVSFDSFLKDKDLKVLNLKRFTTRRSQNLNSQEKIRTKSIVLK